MKKEVEFLANFSNPSKELIWIVDQHWKDQLKKYRQDELEEILDLMELPTNTWESYSKIIHWKDRTFHCHVRSSQKNQIRWITVEAVSITESSAIDCNAVSYAFGKMMHQINFLYSMTQEMGLEHLTKNINAMVKEWRISYRVFFMHKLLKEIQEGKERKERFSIVKEMEYIYEKMQNAFEDDADIKLNIVNIINNDFQSVYFYEDKRLFSSALISAVILCCPNPEKRQDIVFELMYEARNRVKISIIVTERFENSKNIQNIPDKHCFSSFSGEQKILQLFCSRNHGNYQKKQEILPDQRKRFMIQLKFQTARSSNYMSSSFLSVSDGVNDIYDNMLARLRVLDHFREKEKKK